jgi:hypothetical protein
MQKKHGYGNFRIYSVTTKVKLKNYWRIFDDYM